MVPASCNALSLGSPGAAQRTALITAAACLSIGGLLLPQALKTAGRRSRNQVIVSPPKGIPASRGYIGSPPPPDLPYPPDALPGARDVDTPYGSVRVYEWGPETGERVLLVHGISTPSVALGDLAHELANRGYRVMLFDLFGRGYSDAPTGVDYDARLYVSQMLLVLASSHIAWWTGGPAGGFHLVGYSLGGGLSVAFARHMPHLVRSLSLVAPGGLIRRDVHVGWRSRLLYDSFVARRLLPGILVRYLVRRRIRPPTPSQAEPAEAEIVDGDTAGPIPLPAGGADNRKREAPPGNSDASGGAAFDAGLVMPRYGAVPGATVSSVVRWQVDRHEGFVAAFLSTIRHAPIYAPQGDWAVLSSLLAARRRPRGKGSDDSDAGTLPGGLCGGRIHMVLGENDPVIVRDEAVHDAREVLGPDGVAFTVLPAGGHEIPMSRSVEVAEALVAFWDKSCPAPAPAPAHLD